MGESKEKKRARLARYKAEGKCITCGKPRHNDKARCKPCLERFRRESIERNKHCRSMGICLLCRRADARPNKALCVQCAKEQSQRQVRTMDDRKAAGLCTQCGKPSPKTVKCETCLAKQRVYAKRAREKRSREKSRYSSPLCPDCGGKRAPGWKRCWACMDARLKKKGVY